MRRILTALAAACLLGSTVGCHTMIVGICDCDSCMYGCCGCYPNCPGGPNCAGGVVPPAVVPPGVALPATPAPETLKPMPAEAPK